MKSFIITFLFLFFGFEFATAQDSLVILSPKMFEIIQAILLSAMDGWLFKAVTIFPGQIKI